MVQKHIRNHAMRGNHQHYARITHPNPQRHVVPTTVLTRSRLVPLTTARPDTAVVPQTKVQHQRPTKNGVNKTHSPNRRPINLRPSPTHDTFHPKVTTAKAPQGNPQHALKDKGVINSRCSRHMIGNMSYLSDFKEINGRYVAFGGNPKGGKISEKDTECNVLSPEFKLPDENQMLLRVLRENNMYNVDLKNIVPSGDLIYLFAKGIKREFSVPRTPQQNGIAERKNRTLIEAAKTMLADSLLPIPFWAKAVNTACYVQNRVLVTKPQNKTPYELLLGKTPSIGFMRPFGCPVYILNTLDPLGKFDGNADEGFLVRYSNTDDDVAFKGKKPEFEEEKPESEVHVSLSSSAQTKKHDDKTKREAKGKTLEDITYSDDEDDVGAEADFTNLETNITVNPIPTTRVHKDHHVTQIIGDLSSATQTRSMTRVVKDQGGLTQINNEDFHRCMFACLLSQEEPKREEGINYEEFFAQVARIEAIRLFLAYASFMGFMVYQIDVKSAFLYGTSEEEVYVCKPPGFEDPDYPDKVYKVLKALYGLHQALRAWYETLANYLLENGFQRGKIDQTLFIKKQKGDILLVQVYVDDIIFGSTNKDLCKSFEKLMKDKFKIS
nr:putative ribonuclease H-like domain-containing protein [Tanacetum cinerariifolium]